MNRWGIPADIEAKAAKRDRKCVYCGVQMTEPSRAGGSRKNVATWEHINNERWDDISIMPLNVVRCCGSCNSSKSARLLFAWFETSYCKNKGIDEKTVGAPVKAFLEKHRNLA